MSPQVNDFMHKYLKPFFFSSSDEDRVKPAYIYAFILFVLLITCVVQLLVMVWRIAEPATNAHHMNGDAAVVLGALGGVITLLGGMMGWIIKLYNDGKTVTSLEDKNEV